MSSFSDIGGPIVDPFKLVESLTSVGGPTLAATELAPGSQPTLTVENPNKQESQKRAEAKAKKDREEKGKGKGPKSPTTGGTTSGTQSVTDDQTGATRAETAQERARREEMERQQLLQEKLKTIQLARKGKGDLQKAEREEQKFRFDLFEKGLELDALGQGINGVPAFSPVDDPTAVANASPLLQGLGIPEDPEKKAPEGSLKTAGERALSELINGARERDLGQGITPTGMQALVNLSREPGNAESAFQDPSVKDAAQRQDRMSPEAFAALTSLGPNGLAMAQAIRNPVVASPGGQEDKQAAAEAERVTGTRFSGALSDENVERLVEEANDQRTLKGTDPISFILGTVTNIATLPAMLFSEDLRKSPIGSRIFGASKDPVQQLRLVMAARNHLKPETRYHIDTRGGVSASSSNLDSIMNLRKLGDYRRVASSGGRGGAGGLTANAIQTRLDTIATSRTRLNETLAETGNPLGMGAESGPLGGAFSMWENLQANITAESIGHAEALMSAGLDNDLTTLNARVAEFVGKHGDQSLTELRKHVRAARKTAFDSLVKQQITPGLSDAGRLKPEIVGGFGTQMMNNFSRFEVTASKLIERQLAFAKGRTAKTKINGKEALALKTGPAGFKEKLEKWLGSNTTITGTANQLAGRDVETEVSPSAAGARALATLMEGAKSSVKALKNLGVDTNAKLQAFSEDTDSFGVSMSLTQSRSGRGAARGGASTISIAKEKPVKDFATALQLYLDPSKRFEPNKKFIETAKTRGILLNLHDEEFVRSVVAGKQVDSPFFGEVVVNGRRVVLADFDQAVQWMDRASKDGDIQFRPSRRFMARRKERDEALRKRDQTMRLRDPEKLRAEFFRSRGIKPPKRR